MADDFRYLFPSVDTQLYSKWDQFAHDMMVEYEDIVDEDYTKYVKILKKENLQPGKQIKMLNLHFKTIFTCNNLEHSLRS